MSAAEPTPAALRDTAVMAARSAGALLLERYAGPKVVERRDPHDVKLELDRLCERLVLEIIEEDFPAHCILSEEAGFRAGRAPYVWLVDPLDGTVNYYHHLPFFCTSVACCRLVAGGFPRAAPAYEDLELLAGAVYCPLSNELFEGLRGGGAFLNGKPLTVPRRAAIEDSVVSVALSPADPGLPATIARLAALAARVRKLRSLGSTALEIVQVAAGRLGAFVQGATHPWDLAAAALVLTEAGGVVEVLPARGGRLKVLAASRSLAAPLRELLQDPLP